MLLFQVHFIHAFYSSLRLILTAPFGGIKPVIFFACVGDIYANSVQTEPLIVSGKFRAKQFGTE